MAVDSIHQIRQVYMVMELQDLIIDILIGVKEIAIIFIQVDQAWV
jgi:hypothetical protein